MLLSGEQIASRLRTEAKAAVAALRPQLAVLVTLAGTERVTVARTTRPRKPTESNLPRETGGMLQEPRACLPVHRTQTRSF